MALNWEQVQKNIFSGESGGDYDALFGYQNRPDGLFSNIKVSQMPVGDVIKFTSPSGEYGQYVKSKVGHVATPVGAYQVVGSTLREAVNALGIDPNQRFDRATQDRIGKYILKTQGTSAWEGYGKGGAMMANQANQATQPAQQQSQGLLGGILGGQGIGGALGLSDDFRDRLKMGLLLGSDPRAFAPMVAGMQQAAKERRAEAKLQAPKKATVEYLKKQGFNEIADLVDAGSITAAAGATLAYQEGQAIKGLERSMAIEAFKAGIKPEKPLTELAKIQADYAAGRLSPEQYETAVQVYANKNKMGLRVGADGAIQFTQGGDFKFTEQQSKDNVYATRAAGALEAFEPVASALTSFPMRAAEFDPTGVARGAVQSDEFQLAQQSGNEFLQAVLRKDTGAAITPNEMILYGKTYLPQPGDNEKVLAQKSLARKRAVAAIQSGMSPLQILTSEKALAAGRPSEQAATAPTGDLSVLSDAELDALIGDLTGGEKK